MTVPKLTAPLPQPRLTQNPVPSRQRAFSQLLSAHRKPPTEGAKIRSESPEPNNDRRSATPKTGEETTAGALQAAALCNESQGALQLPSDVAPAKDLEGIFSKMVSRVAYGGGHQVPMVHIALGHGGLAGSDVLIERNARGIRVKFSGLSSVDRDRYRAAIERRLSSTHLEIDEIEIE